MHAGAVRAVGGLGHKGAKEGKMGQEPVVLEPDLQVDTTESTS